jgi:hypothetical protein
MDISISELQKRLLTDERITPSDDSMELFAIDLDGRSVNLGR